MKTKRVVLLGLFLAGPGWMLTLAQGLADKSQSVGSPERVPFCTLAAHSKNYNGRLVVTEADIGMGFHFMVLFDPLCGKDALDSGQNLSANPTFHGPRGTTLDKQLDNLVSKEGIARIVFAGRVDSSRDVYGEGSPLEINIESLISVYEIPAAEQEFFGIAKGK